MPDLLFPEDVPQGAASTFGTPAPAAPPNTTSPAIAPQPDHAKKGGGDSGGKGGFLGSPWAQALLPILAGGLGAATGGLALPALFPALLPALGLDAAAAAGIGGALGGGLESGIANKSPIAGLTGALEGAAVGFGGEALLAGAGLIPGVTAAGAAAPAASTGAAAAAGAAPASVAAGGGAGPLAGAATAPEAFGAASDPVAALLGGAGGGLAAGSPALAGTAATAPAFFGAAADPLAGVLTAGGAAPGAAAPGAAAGGGALDAFLGGDVGGGLKDVATWLAKNPTLALGGLSSIGSLLAPPAKVPGGLQAGAKELNQFAKGAIPAEMTGNLPPGAAALVSNALHDTEASIRQQYASLGLSGSTMETQDIAAANERAAAEKFKIASSITEQGLQAAGMADSVYAQIAQLQMSQDSQLRDALTAFSSALGLGGGLMRIPSAAGATT